MGRHEDALQTCSSGLEHHPDFSGATILMGRILMEMSRFAEAEQQLVGLLRRVPNHLLAHQLLARIYLKLRQSTARHCHRQAH